MIRLSGLGEDRVWKPKPLDSVIILGMGHSLGDWFSDKYMDTHLGERAGEQIWTMNAGAFTLQHHVSFNMHDFEQATFLQDWYKPTHGRPVVTCRAMPHISCTFEYPLAEVLDFVGDNYFMNTAAYMIVFALMCGVKRIRCFGMDYNYSQASKMTAYEAGRCSIEFWLGYARAKGVDVASAGSSTLMDVVDRLAHGIYGYGDCQPLLANNPRTGRAYLAGFDNHNPAYKHRPVDLKDIRDMTPEMHTGEYQDQTTKPGA